MVTLFHPKLPGVGYAVPDAAVDAWTAAGWLNNAPPTTYRDHAPIQAVEVAPGEFAYRAEFDGGRTVSLTGTNAAKLGPLLGAYSNRTTRAIAIVGLGSSTVEGVGASNASNRWLNKLAARLQAAYPNGTGSESAVGTLSTPRRIPAGIHVYNGGLGGTTSADYLTDSKVAQVGALIPRAVIHMVGSNDMANNMAPATYRANLISWLDKLDAVCPAPYVNVLVHAHKRGGNYAHPFSAYGEVMRAVADARPNAVFIDLEKPFSAAGVPDPDVLDLLGVDTTHLTDAGHDFMFRLMATHFGAVDASAPPASIPTGTVVSSDAFTGADNTLTGRVTDNALGGNLAKTWAAAPAGEIGTSGGNLVRTATTATFFAGVGMDTPDYEIAFTLRTLSGGDLFIPVRRATNTTVGSPDDYRLGININGTVNVAKRVSGTITNIATAGTVVAGDRIAFRVKGAALTVFKNGSVIWTGTDTAPLVAGPGFTGISGTTGTTGFVLDNMTISTVL